MQSLVKGQWGTYRTNNLGGTVMQSGCVVLTARVLLPCYAAFIHYMIYIQHVLTHVVDMLYSYNSW